MPELLKQQNPWELPRPRLSGRYCSGVKAVSFDRSGYLHHHHTRLFCHGRRGGGGGLGGIAINYGYYRYEKDIMLVTVTILVIIVQIIQEIGMRLARKSDKRIR